MTELAEKENRTLTNATVIVVAAYIGIQMISDISSLQIVSLFGVALDGGTFVYPLAFTMRDLAQKALGKQHTRVLIFSAAAINLVMAVVFYLISLFPIEVAAGGSAIWAQVLTPVWRITLASIAAELCSELLDTEVYSWWTQRVTTKMQWSRVLVSNLVSVPLDSFIFTFAAFFGTMPTDVVWEIFFGNVVIKVVVTLLSLPMIYLVKEPESQASEYDSKTK